MNKLIEKEIEKLEAQIEATKKLELQAEVCQMLMDTYDPILSTIFCLEMHTIIIQACIDSPKQMTPVINELSQLGYNQSRERHVCAGTESIWWTFKNGLTIAATLKDGSSCQIVEVDQRKAHIFEVKR